MPPTPEPIAFALCLSSDDYADLIARKVYRVLPDDRAASLGCLRVIDESGEDYLYPAARFEPLALSAEATSRLLATESA